MSVFNEILIILCVALLFRFYRKFSVYCTLAERLLSHSFKHLVMDDEEPLLSMHRFSPPKSSAEKKTFAHLPLLRFTSIATILVASDPLVSIALWLAGGDSLYLEDSIEDFSIYTSTFDLACLSAARGILIVCGLYYLERYSLMSVSSKIFSRQVFSKRIAALCHASILILALSSLVYSLVKGILILMRWDAYEADIHVTYKILCCFAVAATIIEVVIGLSTFCFMRRLTYVLKLRLVLNENEETVSVGEGEKKSADLKRLASLAIPVSGSDCQLHTYMRTQFVGY